MRLREAGPEDADFLRRLNRRAYEQAVTRRFGAWDGPAQNARMDAKIARGAFRIVEIDGRAVGAVWSAEEDDHVRLHEVVILPEHQSRGIGTRLVRDVMAGAREAGKPVRLHTFRIGRAREFYARLGFAETGGDEVFVDMEWPAQRSSHG